MDPLFTLNIRGTLREFTHPAVMGILNVTPDSFYAGSRTFDSDSIRRRTETIVNEGADFIDIGAYSTRPGATEVSPDEELRRLERAMSIVRKIAPDILISVDTFRARVAETAITSFGCDIVNDVSGTNLDSQMVSTIAKLRVPYILTHSRGTPANMAEFAKYENVTADVLSELGERLQWLVLEGINDVIIDPGIGFAKTPEQNYRLIHDLEVFKVLHRPILMGISRKSLLTRLLNISPDEALEATTALNVMCLERGTAILRVHDVAAAVQCTRIHSAVNNPNLSLKTLEQCSISD